MDFSAALSKLVEIVAVDHPYLSVTVVVFAIIAPHVAPLAKEIFDYRIRRLKTVADIEMKRRQTDAKIQEKIAKIEDRKRRQQP